MITVLSPAKTLDFDAAINYSKEFSDFDFSTQSKKLAKTLKKYTPERIGALMNISEKLSNLNYERFQDWKFPFDESKTNAAIAIFKGDVYQGLNVESWEESDFDFAQNHLRILSGLYGILKPLDKILPYRLEMGTKLEIGEAKNLYEFWGEKLIRYLSKELKPQPILLNLASVEYFKALDHKKQLKNVQVISPVFKDYKNGKYKIISFYAKKARGLMASFVIKNRINDVESLKAFSTEGYLYSEEESKPNQPVFLRDEQIR